MKTIYCHNCKEKADIEISKGYMIHGMSINIKVCSNCGFNLVEKQYDKLIRGLTLEEFMSE